MSSEKLAIQARGLHRRFREGDREHIVLDGVDLDIRRGETVALRGRSGSGKSTLLNLVGGIDAPDAGTVTVDGVELTGLSEHDRTLFRRERIGFVYQAFNLVPTLSVADNVRLVLELNKVPPAEASARIEITPTCCRVENSNVSQLRGHCPTNRLCCLPMNRQATSTMRRPRTCWHFWTISCVLPAAHCCSCVLPAAHC
jgi:ABC-type lipoprotein export system ATPase subunit